MIGHTNAGMNAGWFLDSVQIMVPVHGKHYMFPCHRWLDKDEADGKTQVEIYPSEILDVEQCRQCLHNQRYIMCNQVPDKVYRIYTDHNLTFCAFV